MTAIVKTKEKQHRFLDRKYIEAPYQGNENYVFFSYAHKDKEIAKDLLAFLQFHGIRVWYDAGIEPGDNWMNVIADKLYKAEGMILLSGENAVRSVHVQTEVRNALNWGKSIIRINLDDSRFDMGIELYLNPLHRIKNEISENSQELLFGKEVLS